MNFELPTFRVDASAYLKQLGRMFLHRCWLGLSCLPVACGVTAIWIGDVRWLIVGGMILFMAVPMVLALAYINYGLSMEARWSLLDKSVTIGRQGISLHFDDERMHGRVICWDEVSGVRVGGDSFLIMLSVRRYTFLMIPFDQVERAGIPLGQFARALAAHCSQKNKDMLV